MKVVAQSFTFLTYFLLLSICGRVTDMTDMERPG